MSRIKLPGENPNNKAKISISINGMTGAGKTTVARAIEFLLKNAGFEVQMNDDAEDFPPLYDRVRDIANRTFVSIHTQRSGAMLGKLKSMSHGLPEAYEEQPAHEWSGVPVPLADHHYSYGNSATSGYVFPASTQASPSAIGEAVNEVLTTPNPQPFQLPTQAIPATASLSVGELIMMEEALQSTSLTNAAYESLSNNPDYFDPESEFQESIEHLE